MPSLAGISMYKKHKPAKVRIKFCRFIEYVFYLCMQVASRQHWLLFVSVHVNIILARYIHAYTNKCILQQISQLNSQLLVSLLLLQSLATSFLIYIYIQFVFYCTIRTCLSAFRFETQNLLWVCHAHFCNQHYKINLKIPFALT